MKKEVTSNTYVDAWINKNNQVVISDCVFDCDITCLLPESTVDEDGYLVSKEGKRYDLNDADVIAEIGLHDIIIEDESDESETDNQ